MPTLTQYDQQTGVSPAMTPANAQGANLTPAVGQSLQRLGGELDQAGNNLARINYMSTEQDALAHASQIAGEARVQFAQYAQQLQGEVPATGAGYVDKMHDAVKAWGNDAVNQMPTPRTKKVMQEHVSSIWSDFGQHAVAWQYQQGQTYREESTITGIRAAAAAVQLDPTQYEGARRDMLSSINAMHDDLTPLSAANKLRLSRMAEDELAYAASIKTVRDHPQESFNILTGEHPVSDTSIQGKIVAAAKTTNGVVDPNVALAISSYETGGKFDPAITPPINPKTGKPLSSAKGLFQKLETKTEDPDQQISEGIAFIAANNKQMQSALGRAPTPGEQYSAHMLGIGGAKALAKAPDDMPIAQLVGKYLAPPIGAPAATMVHAAQAAYETVMNNGLSGMTVGQAKQHFAQVMQQHMGKTAGYANAPDTKMEPSTDKMPAYFAALTPQTRESLTNFAQSLVNRQDSQEHVTLTQRLNDADAAYNNFEQPKDRPSDSDILRVYGKERGAVAITQLNQSQRYANAGGQLATAGPEQTVQILSQAKQDLGANEPGTFGYSTALLKYNALHDAATNIQNHRIANPIGADRNSLKITQPLDMSSPAFLQGPLNARYEQAAQLQTQWRTPTYKPLDDGTNGGQDEVGPITSFLQNGKPTEVANYLGAMRVAAGSHPERFGALMAQVAGKDPILATAGAVAAYDNDAAAKIIAGRTMMKDEKLIGVMATPTTFDQWWNSNRGQAFGGMVDSSRMNLDAAKAMYAATLPAELRNSKSLDEGTMQMVASRIAPVVQFNGYPTLAPPNMDYDTFHRNVAVRWDDAVKTAGKDPAEWRMDLMRLAPVPHADGVYIAYSGTMETNIAIDFNETPTGKMPPPSLESPTTLTVQKQKFGEKSFYKGR